MRRIFERYCALGCVEAALKGELDKGGIRARLPDGATMSSQFSRGGVYAILRRRLHLGEVHHSLAPRDLRRCDLGSPDLTDG